MITKSETEEITKEITKMFLLKSVSFDCPACGDHHCQPRLIHDEKPGNIPDRENLNFTELVCPSCGNVRLFDLRILKQHKG